MTRNEGPGGFGAAGEEPGGVAERRPGDERQRQRGRQGQHGRARMSRISLRNWRVSARLTALILVPTIVGVLLAGLRVVSSVESVGAYQRHATETGIAGDLRALALALGMERDRSIWSQVSRQQRTPLARQREVVDAAAAKVRADLGKIDVEYGDRAVEDARQVGTRLDALAVIRKGGQPAEYGSVVAAVLRLHDELLQHSEDPQLIGGSRGLVALAHAKEEASQQRGALLGTLARGQHFTPDTLEAFIASRSRQRAELASFNAEAGADNGRLLAQTVQGGQFIRAELTKSWAIALASRNLPIRDAAGRATAIKQWFDDSTRTIDLLGQVEQRVASAVAARGAALESTERRNAITAGVLILALILLVLTTTVLIARSMVRPLRRLRSEALEIAGYRLPGAVRRMRETGDGTQAPDVQPILVGTSDEIGEVATAFDEVHRQALLLAAEESQLRGNVNAMFVNLSRRIQTLVERQISLIDGLERGEQDGGRLADLFKLDHLATRMRRNSENLLVLAGHEAARKRSQPAKLVDVVRASLSEVEDYQRVTVKVHRGSAIAGHAANDVVHLIAELVENALSFSPGTARVVVSSSMIEGGGALLAISDAGIGMTPEEITEVNRRLADPPVVDVSVSRRMGLFVVGRLALRHGIRVQLRRGDTAGLIAMVLFPPQLITVDAGRGPAMAQPGLRADQAAVPGPATGGNGAPAFGGTGSFAPFATPGTGPSSAFGDPVTTPPPDPRRADVPQVPRQAAPPRTGPATGPPVPAAGPPTGPYGPRTGPAPADPPTGPFNALPDPLGSPSGPLSSPSGPLGSPSGLVPGDSGSYVTRAPEPFVTRADAPGSYADGGPPTGPFLSPMGNGFTPEAPTGPFGPPVDASVPADGGPLGPRTGPGDSSLERGDEFLPIFAAVESAWFRRPDAPARGEAGQTPEPPAAPDRREAEAAADTPAGGWGSSADQGWQAADAVKDPSLGGITAAGLPKRTPKANLVPGSAAPAAAPAPPPVRPELSADLVRARMSRFQQGIRRGRADISEGASRAIDPDGPPGD
ncbi:nitrate- and nitrite sensing domain-containing protein [Sphaerisporangium sp. B11E5]|uniref:sensor histidine kinase n=1 Tax=Sphaerisporangium sp. B11E5 TaxID=3153563 RepID=UPI00325CC134